MSDKGYSFATPEEPPMSFQKRLDELIGTDSTSEEWIEPDMDRFTDQDIKALHAEEIATATADAQCIVKVDWFKVYEAAWYDAEVAFYDAHRAEVDAWFDEQEAAMGKK